AAAAPPPAPPPTPAPRRAPPRPPPEPAPPGRSPSLVTPSRSPATALPRPRRQDPAAPAPPLKPTMTAPRSYFKRLRRTARNGAYPHGVWHRAKVTPEGLASLAVTSKLRRRSLPQTVTHIPLTHCPICRNRRVLARQPPRGPDRAQPPGPSRSARPPFPAPGRCAAGVYGPGPPLPQRRAGGR